MQSYEVYSIIGVIHVLGFIVYMAILKFGLKKSITEKMIGYYVLAWLIGLLIFSISWIVINEKSFDMDIAFATGGELFGLATVFLILDGIV